MNRIASRALQGVEMKPFIKTRFLSLLSILSVLIGAIGMPSQTVYAAGIVSLLSGITYEENFNTLATSGFSDGVPNGWYFVESLTNADTTYRAGTGSDNTGDTYSFGANSDAERALGQLRSANLETIIGANFSNDTGGAIRLLTISYTGEQWRLGATSRTDRMDFQYSTNATSLTTGTWTDVDALDFTAPVTSGTVGLLDGNASANRVTMRQVVTGLNIPNGSTFWIRWTDLDASGSDDGLAVDDFSLTPNALVDTTAADFSAGTAGDCVVDNTIGDGAVRLNIPTSTSCVFTSRVLNAGTLVDWLNLTATTTLPAGTSVGFEARSGNTPSPDVSWTNWQAASGTITNPGSQYLQYRATLSTTDSGQTPVLENVTINLADGTISTLTSPDGTLSSWNGSFVWTGVNNATHYLLEVYTPAMTQLYRKWYTSAQTGCASGTNCSLTPSDLSLSNGDYQWRVLDYGAYGYGIWTHFKSFALNANCYTLTINENPAGSGTVTAPTQTCSGGYLAGTVVQLAAVPGSGYVFSSWSGDASGTTNPVSVTMDANKSVTANMRGNTPISPSGTLTGWDKSFTWTGLSDATHYLLEVQTSGGTQVFRKWYTSSQTGCLGATACSVTPTDLSLANGDYQWRVLDYGAYGYGINSAFKTFTLNTACYTLTTNVNPAGSGTVNVPAQSCPGGYIAGTMVQLTAAPGSGYAFSSWSGDAGGTTNPVSVTMNGDKTVTANMRGNTPISPSGTLTSWNNTYTWTGLSDATWYLLEVQTSSGTQVHRKWYTSAQAGCSGGTACSITPSETAYLPNGDYKWRVMDYGAYGYGLNSAFKTFTLNVTPVCGSVIYVDVDSTASSPDGCSWGTAYTSLQDALAAATSGKQIWVANGAYYPDRGGGQTLGDRNASFVLKEGVAIYGGFTGNESSLAMRNSNPATNGTVLSGDIGTPNVAADNSYQVVQGSNLSASTVLDGFTITRGNSNGSSGHGGGIYLTSSSPTLANLIITNNIAVSNGGGMYVISTNTLPEPSYSRPSLTDVTFSNNTAARGGGLYTQNASPTLTRVVFNNNTATSGAGGGMNNQTLTLSDASSLPSLTDVTFNNNTANGGGGMYNSNASSILNRVTFYGNVANRRGGGMLNENANPTLTNVTFYGNISNESVGAAPWGGGGIMNVTSSPTLNNVTFSGNNSLNGSGTAGGDAIRNALTSSPVITNSIFWGDLNDEITSDGTGTTTISYSVVQGGFAGGSNIITTDPKLGTLANNGGFTQTMALGAGSSALDVGNNSICATSDQRGVTRPQGLVCDAGAYELDVVLLIAPSGTLGSWNNTFSWTGQSDATWYLLEVYTPDGSTQVFRKWYTSTQTGCSGGTACSISPPETAGLSGSYKWRILDYGSYGYGTWTSYLNFSVP
jgi:predicted outer membrane repeat protein